MSSASSVRVCMLLTVRDALQSGSLPKGCSRGALCFACARVDRVNLDEVPLFVVRPKHLHMQHKGLMGDAPPRLAKVFSLRTGCKRSGTTSKRLQSSTYTWQHDLPHKQTFPFCAAQQLAGVRIARWLSSQKRQAACSALQPGGPAGFW